MAETVAAVIRRASAFGSKTALIELEVGDSGTFQERRRIAYVDLVERVARACRALERLGVRRGDRFAVLLDNSIDLVVSEWACLVSGTLWVALHARASATELRRVLEDCEPRIVLVCARHRGLLEAAGVPSSVETVLETGREWDALLANAPAGMVPGEVGGESPVRIRYTSGTAGKPKGAVIPRRGYDASLVAVSEVVGPLRGDDVLLQAAPMTHAAGAMLLPHVAVGATSVLLDRFDTPAVARVLRDYGITATFLVPTMLVRLLEELRSSSAPRLRTIVYGGASMPTERLIEGLDILGPSFVQIYGLTESTWPVTALLREDHLRRPGEPEDRWRKRLTSCGRPTSVGEVRIVDRNGCDVDVNDVGELWVRGRNTMLGYWTGAGRAAVQDTKGLDADGWMHTGDLGSRDQEGYITIVDRLHDMIVSGGFNVYPREVEDALCSHPAVLEAAVVGRPDPEWGERVHAAVVLRPGLRATAEELIAHAAKQIAGYKKPRSLEIVDELPRNSSGKILRRALRG